MRVCRECRQDLPETEFYGRGVGKRPHAMCKTCAIYDEFVRRTIRKAFPKPEDGACCVCRAVGRLEADHDHQLGHIDPVASFRGYKCHSCNEASKPARSILRRSPAISAVE